MGKNPRNQFLFSEPRQVRVTRKPSRIRRKRSLRPSLLLLLATTALLLVGAVIFRNFLFGESVLLYTDIGSDSLNFSYPEFVHFSDYVRNEDLLSWSFCVGMGQDIFYRCGYLILEPVTCLPRHLIAHALVYQHLLKIFAVGLLFFRFLQLRDLKLPASLLGALLLSLSAYMCMGSCGGTGADEVVCFSALLLGAEIAIKRRSWFVLAFAVGLIGLLGAFYLYLCAFFLLFYVPARLFGEYGWQPRLLLRICLILAGAAVLGIGLGAMFTIPNLYALLNSPRGSGATSYAGSLSSFPVFGLESSLHNITAALRPFANDMLGTGDGFHGWQNYVEASTTYCGLICLVFLPQVFVGAAPHHRIIYLLFIAGLLITTVFPWFRYLFWLFQGDYYRAHSLFAILGLLTLSMTAFSHYLEGRRLDYWLLPITVIALLVVLYLPLEDFQAHIDVHLRQEAAVFLILYGALLICGQVFRQKKLVAWCILTLASIELTQFDYLTVSHRKTVTKAQLNERTGYNDETVDAVRYIKSVDPDKFFRITKLYSSGLSRWSSLNDAMVFGYYGTSSYVSFNNLNYINFLTAVDALSPNSEWGNRWSLGLLGHALLSIFACEKYVLTQDPGPIQTAAQYEGMRRYGDTYLLKNDLFLPLGLSFDRYVSEKIFRSLSTAEKAQILLRAVVLSNKESTNRHEFPEATVQELEPEITEVSLPAAVAARRESALALSFFQQTHIEGVVRVKRRSILVLQTPFDQGWRALQDGRQVPTLKADIGLLGMELDSGEHLVALRYSTPYLKHAFVASFVSILLLAAGAWRWPRF
jgi:uncharacterized membrane protein YfhO